MNGSRQLFINSMSRNGSSLLYQLLAGHPDINYFPGRIHFACAQPRFWPLLGCESCSPDLFVEELGKRFALEQSTSWQTSTIRSLQESDVFDFRLFESECLRSLETLTVIDSTTLRTAFEIVSNVFMKQRMKDGYQIDTSLPYTLYMEDHFFNCGIETVNHCFSQCTGLQVIRNFYDVMASRKNMLLHHKRFTGDPNEWTLAPEVVQAEWTRWLWSVWCGDLNRQSMPERYHLISFESLRSDRENVLRRLCEDTQLPFVPEIMECMTYSSDHKFGDSVLFMVTSSLAQVTGGKQRQRVGSHKVSLNTDELAEISKVAELYDLELLSYRPEDSSYSETVSRFVDVHDDRLVADSTLNGWFQMYQRGQFDKIMDEYSALNFGSREVERAFRSCATSVL